MSGRTLWRGLLTGMLLPATVLLSAGEPKADDPPSPPPPPSDTSAIGDEVTNPVTGETTTVTDLRVDPESTPTAGETAFVETADGYAFLVKEVGEVIYNGDVENEDGEPLGFRIASKDEAAGTVKLAAEPFGVGELADLEYALRQSELDAQFSGEDTPGDVTDSVIETGADGVRVFRTGQAGSNGRDGVLFVPPRAGGRGTDGPSVTYSNEVVISTTDQIGIEARSEGGAGGRGGDSYLSFWDGRDGGDGGAGGDVTVSNEDGVQVATTGDGRHGIFATSRSGKAGDGGEGWLAPGGGVGGHSSDGGSVTVENRGRIITRDEGSHGIYGLSVSNNGGRGGDQWGLVGEAGSGGAGGDGGPVSITNKGTIRTQGFHSHGVYAQSVGGSGGDAGDSGNLLVSLNGSGDVGGDGGEVDVVNAGSILTTGASSRGIFAQSVGGGGGGGGSSGGLIALGGAGSSGGDADAVTVRNLEGAIVRTTGEGSDAIFAQSVGGSGGSAFDTDGLLVGVGGSGGNAGDGAAVTVENVGTILTEKDASRGIVAQSIGGGGGDGGSSSGLVSVGGDGDGGGDSGPVSVTHGGSITTKGEESPGIFAQAVGGGGGSGGSAGSVGLFAGVAVGGDGAGGGDGGRVDVTLQGRSGGSASVIRT
ncbi:MAG: hypothetical protein R6V44_07260, partial [Paracoccaceae bacterium]